MDQEHPATTPGHVMGTVGYMSPEQVRGQGADHRSDIFALGAILYEMLTGKRAFKRDSSVETMNAILKEEPPELDATVPALTPGLDRVVRHCLEKNPVQRFQSASDIAFDLETISSHSGTGSRLKVAAEERKGTWKPAASGGAGGCCAGRHILSGQKKRTHGSACDSISSPSSGARSMAPSSRLTARASCSAPPGMARPNRRFIPLEPTR